MENARILVVEDEPSLQELITLNLELEGYFTVAVNNGKDGLYKALNERWDLIILDVMLPEISGFDICERIRLENNIVPILFLTAKNTSQDRVTGLKIGGDDYLSKPFNLEEFLLRAQSLLKRGVERSQIKTGSAINEIFRFGKNSINFLTFEIETFQNEKHTLSKKEIQLLKLLIDKKGEVVSRKQILELVWGYDVYPSTRTIDNFILMFRKYFEENSKAPIHFHSIRGVGYKFIGNE
jgi:two-component system, OmpR family, alkaline phosphatase synthesis response regulator PhoP